MQSARCPAPSYRKNPFGQPVIVAEGRAWRPHDSRRHTATAGPGPLSHHDSSCPFCYGNESETPPELDAFRPAGSPPNSSGWQVRVVPNLYPAFVTALPLEDWHGSPLAKHRPARGSHEIAIHSPDHAGHISALEPGVFARTIEMWQQRLRKHRDDGWALTVLAVNEGREAGASLAHPHAQLLAADTLPTVIEHELDAQRRHRQEYGKPLLTAIVENEHGGPRHIDAEGPLLAWTPYWSARPYEVWIATASPDSPSGALADSPHARELATLLTRVTERIRRVASNPAFNIVVRDVPHQLHQPPPAKEATANATWWHVRILPRTAIAAGFELATAIHIVAISPETTAADLRRALASGEALQ